MSDTKLASFRERQFGTQERRCVRAQDPGKVIAAPFEMRAVPNGTGGDAIVFSGYASVVERAYPIRDAFGQFDETIASSAFKKTLRDGCDVAFLTNHSGVTMARTKPGTLRLSSDSTGLLAEARLNPERGDVQIVRAAVEDGALDEMSFAFVTTRQEWSENYSQRRILEVNLNAGDVSVCNFGANGFTAGTVSVAPTDGGHLAQIYDLASHSCIARARLALVGLRSGGTSAPTPASTREQLVRRSRELIRDAERRRGRSG